MFICVNIKSVTHKLGICLSETYLTYLTGLSPVTSRFIQTMQFGSFYGCPKSPVNKNCIFFIHAFADVLLGWFHNQPVVTIASTNTVCKHHSGTFTYSTLGKHAVVVYNNYIFSFSKTSLLSATMEQSPQQYRRVHFCLHHCQCLLFS